MKGRACSLLFSSSGATFPPFSIKNKFFWDCLPFILITSQSIACCPQVKMTFLVQSSILKSNSLKSKKINSRRMLKRKRTTSLTPIHLFFAAKSAKKEQKQNVKSAALTLIAISDSVKNSASLISINTWMNTYWASKRTKTSLIPSTLQKNKRINFRILPSKDERCWKKKRVQTLKLHLNQNCKDLLKSRKNGWPQKNKKKKFTPSSKGTLPC